MTAPKGRRGILSYIDFIEDVTTKKPSATVDNFDASIGTSLSKAFILTSTNPQYDKRLLIDLPVQYMKTTSSEHVVYINCSECQKKIMCVHNMF